MKRTIVVCALGLLGLGASAQGLPQVPSDGIDMRLDMASEQMEKAGRSRLHGALLLVAGGAFAAITTADNEHPDLSKVIAASAVLGYASFTIKGAIHDGKAAKHLSRHK